MWMHLAPSTTEVVHLHSLMQRFVSPALPYAALCPDTAVTPGARILRTCLSLNSALTPS